MKRTVMLPDGTSVPAIGQGTWMLGERKSKLSQEAEALLDGIDAGMNLLDTAEMYGDGKSEALIARVLEKRERKNLFLVSKVYPHNAGRKNIFKSCMNSLERMNADYMDLYLLHWRGAIPLAETVACMEQLVKEGKIRHWGVSNFDTDDMKELWLVPGGKNCAVNQVLYHAASRGIEYDLIPWMKAHGVPVMAYCPLAQGGDLERGLYEHPVLNRIARRHQATVAQLLLAWVIRSGDMIAIPRTGRSSHALENAAAADLILTPAELAEIDEAYPAPKQKVYLEIV